jgi:hypothetical protein
VTAVARTLVPNAVATLHSPIAVATLREPPEAVAEVMMPKERPFLRSQMPGDARDVDTARE